MSKQTEPLTKIDDSVLRGNLTKLMSAKVSDVFSVDRDVYGRPLRVVFQPNHQQRLFVDRDKMDSKNPVARQMPSLSRLRRRCRGLSI